MKDLIIKELKLLILHGETYPVQKIGARFWKELLEMSSVDKDDIIKECGKTASMGTELKKGIAVGEYLNGR